jgi:hypothetical protein
MLTPDQPGGDDLLSFCSFFIEKRAAKSESRTLDLP